MRKIIKKKKIEKKKIDSILITGQRQDRGRQTDRPRQGKYRCWYV